MGALKALISFYTIFHMNITQEDMDAMEARFYLTPLVGIVFGFLVLVVVVAMDFLSLNFDFGNSMALAALVLLTVYTGSKFLHFDGLTDFGDGMIVSGEQSDHIRALKDTLVGAGGIGVALITVLCSFAFYSMTGQLYALLIFPVIEVMVKNAMVVAASFGKPGNGMAARQVARTTPKSAAIGIVISIIASCILLGVVILIFYLLTGELMYVRESAAIVIVGLIVSTIMGLIMARTANRVFGMVNGDILGATNEVSRPFLAFFLCLTVTIISTVI